MRPLSLLFCLLCVTTVSVLSHSTSREGQLATAEEKTSAKEQLEIVPLVTLKPGETKELLFSTWCTVGITRGGGFSLAEMVNGKAAFKDSTLKGNRSFSKQGVTISVPDFKEGTEFSEAAEFAPLKKINVDAFKVTIVAARDARPGLLEMHLVDATCAGHCKTDFRVLVLGQ